MYLIYFETNLVRFSLISAVSNLLVSYLDCLHHVFFYIIACTDLEVSEEVPVCDTHDTRIKYEQEIWDEDEIFSDSVTCSPNNALSVVVSKKQKNAIQQHDEHFFLPAQLHSQSCFQAPNEFCIVSGQFDDAE